MPTSVNVTNLKINELKESQYDTAVQQGVIGENELSILTDVDAGQVIQVSTLPTASADELGNIYQFVGTTDANYTNGYFYKCVSDGQNPATYSWSNIQVQAGGGGLPSQTGHLGEFLTTDGYVADWSPLAMVATTGSYNNLEDTPEIPTEATQVGAVPEWGSMPTADAEYENLIVQYSGATTSTYTNGYFYRCDSTLVSAASATISQTGGSSLSDLAVVAADFESYYPDSGTYDFVFDGSDWYYDEEVVDLALLGITFSGTPDADDTIEVVFIATEYSYAWNRVDVQPGGGLPSQTGNAGKFLITDGTDASWSNVIDARTSGKVEIVTNGVTNSIFIRNGNAAVPSKVYASNNALTVSGNLEISIGNLYSSYNNGYTLGTSNKKWANVYTTTINNGSNITIPTTGGTMAVIGVNTTITLTSAGWSSNTQTVNVTGMTATGVVMVSPDPTDQADFTSAGILCTAQAAGTLTFTCDTVPSADIDVNVVML